MGNRQKVVVKKEREVRTYVDMWHTSNCLLKKGKEEDKASYHQFMASLVFTAFTLEAYLNHIGPKVFSCWDDLERLGPKEKLNVISEKVGLEIDYSRRPWQVMKRLFGFRNDIAHGKSVKIKSEETIPIKDHVDDKLHGFTKTKWEEYCTENNAESARKDVESIINEIHSASGIKSEYPFVGGLQISGATIVEE